MHIEKHPLDLGLATGCNPGDRWVDVVHSEDWVW